VITGVSGAGGLNQLRRVPVRAGVLGGDTVADGTGAYRGPVRQLILSPRWILWHVLTLGAMATCGFLAVWQWQRAGSSMGSALNVGYGLQWPVFAVFFGYMWWRFLRMAIADLHAEPGEVEPAGVADVRGAAAEPVRDEPSPFGPRPAGYRATRASDQDDPEVAEYNRMLAALAARDAAG
jgi:DNA-binding transcriptional regulator of glucitol operon